MIKKIENYKKLFLDQNPKYMVTSDDDCKIKDIKEKVYKKEEAKKKRAQLAIDAANKRTKNKGKQSTPRTIEEIVKQNINQNERKLRTRSEIIEYSKNLSVLKTN
jgi:hypothetical protein